LPQALEQIATRRQWWSPRVFEALERPSGKRRRDRSDRPSARSGPQ
jgi:hypothetical protein